MSDLESVKTLSVALERLLAFAEKAIQGSYYDAESEVDAIANHVELVAARQVLAKVNLPPVGGKFHQKGGT